MLNFLNIISLYKPRFPEAPQPDFPQPEIKRNNLEKILFSSFKASRLLAGQ